jgi:hypothetical protein
MKGKIKWVLIALGLAVALVAGITTAVSAASAQDRSNYNLTYQNCFGAGGAVYGQAVSDLLGMTPEQILAQRQAGQSLAQIAAGKGITEDALINAILQDRQTLMQQMVTAGSLTQDQLNQRLDIMKQNVKRAVESTAVGPAAGAGFGGCGVYNGAAAGPNVQGDNSSSATPGAGAYRGGRGMMGGGFGMMGGFGRAGY